MPQDLGLCESCEGSGRIIMPDPSPNTQEENIAFRKKWDEQVETSKSKVT